MDKTVISAVGTCRSCKFFNHSDRTQPPECRRFPPVTTLFLAGVSEAGGPLFNKATTYASVHGDLWCGEHKPRIVKANNLVEQDN